MGSLFSTAIRLPLRLIPSDTVLPVLGGALRGKRWISSSGTHGCWLGTYERDTQRTLRRCIRRGDTVFDIGANAGYFTLLASSIVGESGHVVAFEPLPRNVAYLMRHLELNRMTNVIVVTAAVSDVSGEGFLSAPGEPSMGSLAASGIAVKLIALDDFMSEHAVPRPSTLKIDVEGAESRVLAGARGLLRSVRPAVVLSTHGWRQHDTCCRFLAELGYRITIRRDGALDGMYELVAESPAAREDNVR